MRTRRISKGILSVGAWNVAKIVASALAAPMLSRLLGAEGYGQYASYVAIIFLASPFANLGTSYSLTKTIAEGPQDPRWRRRIAAFAARVNSLGVLIAGASVAVLVFPHPPAGTNPIVFVAVLVGALALDQIFFFSRGILYGLHREELAGVPAALGAIVGPTVGVVLALNGFGILGVLMGLFAGNLCVAIITLTFVRQQLPWQAPSSSSPEQAVPVRALLTFGFSSMLFSALSMALYKANIVLLRVLSPDGTQAGLYATAVQLSEFVWVIPLAVEGIMLQTTARLWAEHRTGDITALMNRLLRYTALGTGFFLVIVLVFAGPIVRLYFGPAFSGADTALRILVPGVFSFSLARVMWPVIQARGNVLALVTVIAGATFTNIALNCLLIPKWGAAGAAVATSISYGGVAFAYAWIIRRWGVKPFQSIRGGRLLIVYLITIAVMAVPALLIPSAWLALLTGGAAAALTYAVATLRLDLLGLRELQQIVESLPGFLRRPGLKLFAMLRPLLGNIVTE